MEPSYLQELTKLAKSSGSEFCVVRPGISAHLYLPGSVRAVASLVADSIESFGNFIGRQALTHYSADNGYMKPLDSRKFARDLKLLRSIPEDSQEVSLHFCDTPNGGASGQGIFFAGRQQDHRFPDRLSIVRFDFDPSSLEKHGASNIKEFTINAAVHLRAQSANLGWTFQRGTAFMTEATREVNQLLPRYLAFDPGYFLANRKMHNRTSWAHWTNIVHRELFEKCGGESALQREAPNTPFAFSGDLCVIQGSKLPPLGDVNRGAKDIGELPGVARFLKPTRIALTGLGDSVFDVSSWLARFDTLELRPWDNSEWVP